MSGLRHGPVFQVKTSQAQRLDGRGGRGAQRRATGRARAGPRLSPRDLPDPLGQPCSSHPGPPWAAAQHRPAARRSPGPGRGQQAGSATPTHREPPPAARHHPPVPWEPLGPASPPPGSGPTAHRDLRVLTASPHLRLLGCPRSSRLLRRLRRHLTLREAARVSGRSRDRHALGACREL